MLKLQEQVAAYVNAKRAQFIPGLKSGAFLRQSVKLAVPGNHDGPNFAQDDGWKQIHGRSILVAGIRFGGLGGCLPYKGTHWVFWDDEVLGILGAVGPCDVLLSHNSPAGVHDRNDGVHGGFASLSAYISTNQPSVVLHGHQHVSRETRMGSTLVRGIYGAELLELN